MTRNVEQIRAGHEEIIRKIFEIRNLHSRALRATDHGELADLLDWEGPRTVERMSGAMRAAAHLPEPTRVLAMLNSVCDNLHVLARDMPRLLRTVGYPTVRRLLAGEVGSDPPLLGFVSYVVEETMAAYATKPKAGGWSRQVAFAYDNYMGRVTDKDRRRRLERFAIGLMEKGERRYYMLMRSLARKMSNHLVIVRRNLLNGLAKQGKIVYTHDRHSVVRCRYVAEHAWPIHNPEGLDRRDVLFFNDHFAVDHTGRAVLIDDLGPRELTGFADDPSRSTPLVGEDIPCGNLGVIYRTSFRKNCCRLIKVPYSYLRFITPFLLNLVDLDTLFRVHVSDLNSLCAMSAENVGLANDQKYTNTIARTFNEIIYSLFGFRRDLDPYWIKFGAYSMQGTLEGRDLLSDLVRRRLISELGNGSLLIAFDEHKFRARHGSGTSLRLECRFPPKLDTIHIDGNLQVSASVRGINIETSAKGEVLSYLADRTGTTFQELSLITDVVMKIMGEREIASYNAFFKNGAHRGCSREFGFRDPKNWITYHTGSPLVQLNTRRASDGSVQIYRRAQEFSSEAGQGMQSLFLETEEPDEDLTSYPVHPNACACDICAREVAVGRDEVYNVVNNEFGRDNMYLSAAPAIAVCLRN